MSDESAGLSSLAKRLRSRKQGFPLNFDPQKKDLIDVAFKTIDPSPQSFADLGAIWGVDGAYSFYALDTYPIRSAYLVDTDVTDPVRRTSQAYENLTLIAGNFGDPLVRDQIPDVETIFLFDVLLHQVRPDWDEILAFYASKTDSFVIYNPQFIVSEKTIRLLDLGLEAYCENVPWGKKHPLARRLIESINRVYDLDPRYQRKWKDVHYIWQWGITNHDLIETVEGLGFSLVYHRNHGQFGDLENFENHAFIFQKRP